MRGGKITTRPLLWEVCCFILSGWGRIADISMIQLVPKWDVDVSGCTLVCLPMQDPAPEKMFQKYYIVEMRGRIVGCIGEENLTVPQYC